MITIAIDNSESRVLNADKTLLAELSKVLTYTNDSAEYAYHKHLAEMSKLNRIYKRETDPNILARYAAAMRKTSHLLKVADEQRRVCLLKGNVYPTGLTNRVLEFLDEIGVKWEIQDLREFNFEKLSFRLVKPFPKLRYYQEEALERSLEDERGVVEAATGTGKTQLIAQTIYQLKTKSLIIAPNKSILDNMYDTLIEYYGKQQVAKLSSSSVKLKKINVVNIQTLVNMPPELFSDVGACFIDEFHHAGADSYCKVNAGHLKSCFYRLGYTATNFRNGSDGMALEGVLSHLIYRYDTKQAVKDGFLTKPEFRWIHNSSPSKNTWQSEYKHGVVENKDRNKLVAEKCREHSDQSVLVLVQQINHCENLKELLPDATVITGKEKDEDRRKILDDYRAGKIKLLIGTSVLGEGVDLPIAEVLVLAGGGKSKILAMQNVGRVLRPYPGKTKAIIYDFTDQGTKYLAQHAQKRAEIYRTEYGLMSNDD